MSNPSDDDPVIPCFFCKDTLDPRKEEFFTCFQRKGPAIDFCSLDCLNNWAADD